MTETTALTTSHLVRSTLTLSTIDAVITLGYTRSGDLQKQNSEINFEIEDDDKSTNSDFENTTLARYYYRLHRSKPHECFILYRSYNLIAPPFLRGEPPLSCNVEVRLCQNFDSAFVCARVNFKLKALISCSANFPLTMPGSWSIQRNPE